MLGNTIKTASVESRPESSAVIDIADEQKKELEEIESEMDIKKEEVKCIVHKGFIGGTNIYMCSNCGTFLQFKN